MTVLLWIVAVVLVVAGLLGLVVPALPGPPLVFVGLVVAAWAEGFVHVGWRAIAVLAVLAALAYAVDYVSSAVGARHFGATGWSVVGALLGAVVGLFFGLPGILLGPIIGAIAGELAARRTVAEAGWAGIGAVVGIVLGAAVKIGLTVVMLAVFVAARWFL